jgi:hypothetical protein
MSGVPLAAAIINARVAGRDRRARLARSAAAGFIICFFARWRS